MNPIPKVTFASGLQNAMDRAAEMARGEQFLTLEHLLAALSRYGKDAPFILKGLGVQPDQLADAMIDCAQEHADAGQRGKPPQPTMGFVRVIERAAYTAMNAGRSEVKEEHVLVALMDEPDSGACYFLASAGITKHLVQLFLASGGKTIGAPNEPVSAGGRPAPDGICRPSQSASYLVDLTSLAEAGKLDPLIGRQAEMLAMMRTLCRRRKGNPLLCGEPGVGKTALVEGLAAKLLTDAPDALKGMRVKALNVAALMAGTCYRGDFEQRMQEVFAELGQKPSILFIDEIHLIVGAGAASRSSIDVANLLKPVLAGGQQRCIGATTYEECRNLLETDKALARRFQKLDVPEPSKDDAADILRGLISRYEKHHAVAYEPEAIDLAVTLSAKHLFGRFLPDKAIDVIDEAGAANALLPAATRKATISGADIEAVVAKLARVPVEKLLGAERQQNLAGLGAALRAQVYGQDEAVEAVATAVRLSAVGLRDENKPIGSFLFCGPTGVGKTELAKQLAAAMGVAFVRFDMSEFSQEFTASGLVGAAPGYVGFEQGGRLTEAVLKTPHCVLLLDEIEKAHPKIYDLLLQVMDCGTLTDNRGRQANFQHVVLVMTSNVGAREMEANPIGFGAAATTATSAAKAVEAKFSPEFRNRLDGTLYFARLGSEALVRVVAKLVQPHADKMAERGVKLFLTDKAKAWLAEHGHDPKLGARPLARLIQAKVCVPLANALLSGKLKAGMVVRFDAPNGELTIGVKDEKAPMQAKVGAVPR